MDRKIFTFLFFCLFSAAAFSQKNTSSSRVANVLPEPLKAEETKSDSLHLTSTSKKAVEFKTKKITNESPVGSNSTLMNTSRKQETKIENK